MACPEIEPRSLAQESETLTTRPRHLPVTSILYNELRTHGQFILSNHYFLVICRLEGARQFRSTTIYSKWLILRNIHACTRYRRFINVQCSKCICVLCIRPPCLQVPLYCRIPHFNLQVLVHCCIFAT